jgi:drug/metabolite transporter (DMT)-like permease
MSLNRSTSIGIAAALAAAFVWSLNFAVPFVIGRYSVFDFALVRFVISGALGFGFLAFKRDAVRMLALRDWMVALWLGFVGCVGYFLAVVGAAVFAGPVIAPAFLGLVPVVLALAGNLRQRSVPWRALLLPLTLAASGLVLVNISVFDPASLMPIRYLIIGIPMAIAAVAFWIWFGLLNQSALARRPGMEAGVWTALIMGGCGLQMLAFLPLGLVAGVFRIAQLGLGWDAASSLYVWGVLLAIVSTVGGALAWTVAARRLPVALSAQLVVAETIFGTIFGLIVHGRLPTLTETGGIAVLIVGVIMAVRAFHGGPALAASAA